MYDKFTDRTRRLLKFAYTAAKRSNADGLTADHVFLAILLFDEPFVAGHVLEQLNFDFEAACSSIGIEAGDRLKLNVLQPWPPVDDPAVLKHAYTEAMALGHNYIGIEHLLLAVFREEDSQAANLLLEADLTADTVRGKVVEVLSPEYGT